MNIRDIIKSDAFSGVLLIISLFAALLISNSPFYECFLKIIYFPISLEIGNLHIHTAFITFINHGLMTLFFLLMGLEIKSHIVEGQYKERKNLALPFVAAIGGLVVPAFIYFCFNYNDEALKGWAIPIATDTAFVLGILSFFKSKISINLRIFILGFSLVDDILAIIILAVFYSKTIVMPAFLLSVMLIGLLAVLNYLEVVKVKYYLFGGSILWVALEKAGIHGTLAGIVIALFIPTRVHGNAISPLKRLEHVLLPYVNYLILPAFAFFNSELNFDNVVLDDLFTNLSLGIVLSLLFGKQIGIFMFSYACVRLKYCRLPEGTSWLKFYAIAILGGIGFTLSLFIGGVTFSDQWYINTMRSAIIVSSFLAAVFGTMLLKFLKN